MKCTKCESDNVQRLQVAYELGTQAIDTKSSTVGGGYGGTFGAGVAHTSTTGTQQSLFASRVAPPTTQSYGWPAGLIVAGLLFISTGGWFTALSVGAVAFGGFLAFAAYKFNSETWPEKFSAWRESWICHKCGHVYRQAI